MDGDLLSNYRPYLEHFLSQHEGNFKADPKTKVIIARAKAQIVVTTGTAFSSLKYPRYYYQEFSASFQYTIAKIPALTMQQKEIDKILYQMLQN